MGEFRDRSGLSLDFLDDRVRVRRAEVVTAIRRTISGQAEAVDAMADAVCVAKARLNDPGRPLAAFLFLGPTGVGKTECAKALAAYLFGDAGRLVRFDMNEFVDAASPGRLTGTFDEPEGLLTGVVRRQPFSVVLLDEIEKAHPAVFDVLLAMLGEGRLTDARGRTADFGNAIVILTSNLGAATAAAGPFGLRPAAGTPGADRAAYTAAAERFFRPEFVNRLDRLVPFDSLTREQVAGIAHRLIGEVLGRAGLLQRQCVLSVDPAAMERVIDQGFHPQMGARALKRSLEKQLTQPVAERLAAAGTPDGAAVIRLIAGRDGLAVQVDALTKAARWAAVDVSDVNGVLDEVEATVDRVMAAMEPAGELRQGAVSAAAFRYLAAAELAERVRRTVDELDRAAAAPVAKARPDVRASRPAKASARWDQSQLATIMAEDLESHLAALDPGTVAVDAGEAAVRDLLGEAALLAAMAGAGDDDGVCLVWLRSPNPDATAELATVVEGYRALFDPALGYAMADVDGGPRERAVRVEMPGAARVMGAEAGTHLFAGFGRPPVVVQVIVTATADPAGTLAAQRAADAAWRAGRSSVDPFPLGPVVRVYNAAGVTVDVRSGVAVRGLPTGADVRRFVVAGVRG